MAKFRSDRLPMWQSVEWIAVYVLALFDSLVCCLEELWDRFHGDSSGWLPVSLSGTTDARFRVASVATESPCAADLRRFYRRLIVSQKCCAMSAGDWGDWMASMGTPRVPDHLLQVRTPGEEDRHIWVHIDDDAAHIGAICVTGANARRVAMGPFRKMFLG